jgi:hypothetical protein
MGQGGNENSGETADAYGSPEEEGRFPRALGAKLARSRRRRTLRDGGFDKGKGGDFRNITNAALCLDPERGEDEWTGRG